MILDNKDAVIFDLDGSLVDSMWIWRNLTQMISLMRCLSNYD